MKAVGVVVEYNPFHNGHKHHLQMARIQSQADVVIAVMSGSFLQRGEPAIMSRWARTEMALSSGADIVVELPYAYSVQTATRFAEGAVYILSALGCTNLNFGSEAGDITPFKSLVSFMSKHKQSYDTHVQRFLKQGSSYPNASASAFALLEGSDQLLSLSKPNNILGFHYVQAIDTLHLAMEAETTLRIQSDYHDSTIKKGPIASATAFATHSMLGNPSMRLFPKKQQNLLTITKTSTGCSTFGKATFLTFITKLLLVHQKKSDSLQNVKKVLNIG
ncbi:nucleotidyltransferase family protein [Bacillus sp. JCM 19041]|uniref:nucleotidyltransferase family protein n=1 Tax=Bacillus sp. JCM 19041 TaxID=1460637 RepID=UPI000A4E3097